MESSKIRQEFLEFFRSKEHAIVASAPMVVKGDPTLMFTNAGMNQFKDIFLGNAEQKFNRAADTQKCLRVSGKHNDLEEVGHDTYHHTMFEMLGNWSFGDYFKREAIDWAWELLVERYGMDKSRMYASVFEGNEADGVPFDQEAYDMWREYLPEDHIIRGNKKDNFWEMGESGPCGPCSEIHFDLRDEEEIAKVPGRELVNADNPLVIEIWNLVFMQFNRRANGSLEPLPAKHVDTGMGFERLCMILQGKKSNYDTDVFQPSISKLAAMSGKSYGEELKADIAMRVVADHLRAIAFSIADGQLPSNVKAGYVIRRILRRAVRYGYTYLGFNEPFICRLVEGLVAQMGGQFPELVAQKGLIEKVIEEEENSFLRTLATGINLLDNVIKGCGGTISGKDAFLLYDTYGFPIDLTELIAKEQGVAVDLVAFEAELQIQKERSRSAAAVETDDWQELISLKQSYFVGYDTLCAEVQIARYRKVTTKNNTSYQIVFDQTPFYGNSGGQMGDIGAITSADGERTEIVATEKENGLTIHIVKKLPSSMEGVFLAEVNPQKRESSANNHTATHLLHAALRSILGTHVEQKGSLVTPDHLRFDFSHFQKLTHEELRAVEVAVNAAVRSNHMLCEWRNATMAEAEAAGAMMLFGEKYGDTVRVIRFGDSVELCGGCHTSATGNIGYFKIISEGAISAGVRRIEATTGANAEKIIYAGEDLVSDIAKYVNNPQVLQAIKKMVDSNDTLSKEVEAMRKEQVEEWSEKLIAMAVEVKGIRLIKGVADRQPEFQRDMAHTLRAKGKDIVYVAGSAAGGKPTLTVMLGDDIVAKGLNAGKIVREAAKLIQGGGGGQPFFASAGGKNPEGLNAAVDAAVEAVIEGLG
ncbi:MAG: alanine--tRNA ligase [Rikenellaceae bacterium]